MTSKVGNGRRIIYLDLETKATLSQIALDNHLKSYNEAIKWALKKAGL